MQAPESLFTTLSFRSERLTFFPSSQLHHYVFTIWSASSSPNSEPGHENQPTDMNSPCPFPDSRSQQHEQITRCPYLQEQVGDPPPEAL